jgi:hypothetical protein
MLRCSCSAVASYLGFETFWVLVGLMPSGALFPSKSGLIKKHTVKHTVKFRETYPSKSGLIHKHIVKHIMDKNGRISQLSADQYTSKP